MSISIVQNYTAVVPGANFVKFLGLGGTGPYIYSVVGGGAGGTINASSGAYTAPAAMTAYPANQLYDTILVQDSLLAVATSQILVATPIFLLLDIIQTELGLASDHIYLFDQKVFQPTDSSLYVVGTVQSCKPFANVIVPHPSDGSIVTQSISMYAKIDIDAISRGPAARDQKELIPLALNSIYSEQQQEANGFYIGRVPITGAFINLSQIDGAAIPYRYKISFGMQYCVSLIKPVPYFGTFPTPQIYTNP